MIPTFRLRAALLCLALLSWPLAAQNELPGLGEGSAVSLQQERMLGRAWLMSFRAQVPTVSDPIVQDYLETLIYRLAEGSQLKDRRLELVVVHNSSINAFAVPGGVVGVHDGQPRPNLYLGEPINETDPKLSKAETQSALGKLKRRLFS